MLEPLKNIITIFFALSVTVAVMSKQHVYASVEEERLFEWEVTRVIDGDTVGIRVEWGPLELRKLSIRIRGIDTPEKGYRAKCEFEKGQGKLATQFVTDVIADAAATNTPITFGNVSWGKYGGRIIVPSYSESNQLNYFVARSYNGNYFKYKNPEASKDIIFFENLINWNQPIILCEGVFDAMAIKRNAIPILGKNISTQLYKKIITSSLSDIYIALDEDAQDVAMKIAEKFLNSGFKVYNIKMKGKDPSEMGFVAFTEYIQTAEELDFTNLMMHKLDL